jgi:recombination protein RecT
MVQTTSSGEIVKRSAAASDKVAAWVNDPTFRERIRNMLPAIIKPERFAAVALTSLSRNPKLLECTPVSLIRCLLQAATVGLEVDNGLGHAYLVPFRDRKAGTTECTLILGYRGLVQLMLRSNGVSAVFASVVREGDEFDFELGLAPKLSHRPANDPEKLLTSAYAILYMKDGTRLFDVMSRAEIERVRGRSRASSEGPWVTDYHEMAKKTVLRRLAKLAPMSVEDQRLVTADELADAGQAQLDAFAPEVDVPETEDAGAEKPAPAKAPAIPRTTGSEQSERARLALDRLFGDHEPDSKVFQEARNVWVGQRFPALAKKGWPQWTEEDWSQIADAAEAEAQKQVEESWGAMSQPARRDPA